MQLSEKMLKNPPKEYRAVPFWSWNGKLEEQELAWQIQQMENQGLGGFFMHARGGLETSYMSKEWMKCIQTSLERAEAYDMEAWLYDEEGWPSGFAGGSVTSLGEYYHMRWIEQEELFFEEIDETKNILGIYNRDGIYLGTSKADIEGTGEQSVFYVIYEMINPYYVDVLNPKVIEKFIEVTHEIYRKEFGDEIGRRIPGFFTDEPQFAKLKIPYSICLPEEFEKEHGYALTETFTALFRKCNGYQKYRYDFWKTISRMYTNGFCKTIFNWCEKNNCKLTGHVMREDSLLLQMQATAGVMPSYQYMHMPGIDWLRRRISSPLTPKQAGSVAAQLGKKFVLSEMYAMVGWDCTLEELKWIAQWQYVNGVNRMCQHLESYTIKGIRKRDFPPSLFYQQSFWEEYKKFNDYFARLGMILTQGTVETDVLLIHPMRSGWILYDGCESGEIVKWGQRFEKLSQTLADMHVDHHYGDETIMQDHGSVDGDAVKIGKCSYKVIILPDMLTIGKNTLDLLLKYGKNGGVLISAGKLPQYVEGEENSLELEELAKYVTYCTHEEIKRTVTEIQEFPVFVTENGKEISDIHYQLRKDGENRYLYLVNLSQERRARIKITFRGKWNVKFYDPLDNMLQNTEVIYENTPCMSSVEADIHEAESLVLFIEKAIPEQENVNGIQKNTENKDWVTLGLGGRWDIQSSDWNSLTLDYCEYRIGNGMWKEKINTIQLMDILLEEKKSVHVSLKFKFEMKIEPQVCQTLYLVTEITDKLLAKINGKETEIPETGWWKDKQFRKYDIRSFLQKGWNEIILEIDFRQKQKVYDILFGENVLETERNKLTFDTEIENIYLVGDFGVYSEEKIQYSWRKEIICDGDFVIDRMPEKLYGDDFTTQGFYFFAGKLRIKQNLFIHGYDDSEGVQIIDCKRKRYRLWFEKINAMYGRIYINGKCVKDIMWQPYECDVTEYIHEGHNEVEIELYASNRNLLGPHHHIDGELYAVWPADFSDTPPPFKADNRKVWSDKYHFVKFGL